MKTPALPSLPLTPRKTRSLRLRLPAFVVLLSALIASLLAPALASATAAPPTFQADHEQRLEIQRRRAELTAQGSIPVEVAAYNRYFYNFRWWVDGRARMAIPATAAGVIVTIVYHDASDAVIGIQDGLVDCWVLRPIDVATFSVELDPPAGWNHIEVYASGVPVTRRRTEIQLSVLSSGTAGTGERWYRIRMTNDETFTVVGALPSLWETYTPTASGVPRFFDVAKPKRPFQQRLAAAESVVTTCWANGAPLEPGTFTSGALLAMEALPAPGASPVYRFLNRRTGAHLYTIDVAEANWVLAKLRWLYVLDGIAYNAYPDPQVSTQPLYRFYNKKNGTHFYTCLEAEKENTIKYFSATYRFEGVAYYVCDSGGLATQTVYRFYNKRNGAHFYTASETERDKVKSTLAWLYRYEGPAFTVPK